MFLQNLTMFKDSTKMTESEKLRQLYQCCDKDLSNSYQMGHTDVVNLCERDLLRMIKQLVVIPVLYVVRQSDFFSTRRDLTENTKSFASC